MTVFESLYRMSIAGGFLILGILLVRRLPSHLLHRNHIRRLWFLSVLRLLVPVFFSVLPFSVRKASFFHENVPLLSSLRPAFLPVWALGAIVIAMLYLIPHMRRRLLYAAAIPAADPIVQQWIQERNFASAPIIKQSDRIPSPLVYGLFRPVILLPHHFHSLTPWQKVCVLEHELIHIKHHDLIYKHLAAAALCLHWMNPLVWLLFRLSQQDLELACDEALLRSLPPAQYESYARLLLQTITPAKRNGPECQLSALCAEELLKSCYITIQKRNPPASVRF